MGWSGYQKIKYIVDETLLNSIISIKSFDNKSHDQIDRSTAEEVFTKLKKANIIHRFDKESNILNKKLIASEIFFDSRYNVNLISSLISREKDEELKNTIQYIFQDIPISISKNFIKECITTINQDLVQYTDVKIFSYFSELITADEKYICEIDFKKSIKPKRLLVPLKLFFHLTKLHILFYDKSQNQYDVLEADIILSSKIKTEPYFVNLSQTEMDNEIDKFISGSKEENQNIEVWLKPELLNTISKLNLIESYDILEKKIFIHDVHFDMTSKRKLKEIQDFVEISKNNGTIFFPENVYKNYLFKVKLTGNKYNLALIIKIYIEFLEISDVKSIQKLITSYTNFIYKNTFFDYITRIIWLLITFSIGYLFARYTT